MIEANDYRILATALCSLEYTICAVLICAVFQFYLLYYELYQVSEIASEIASDVASDVVKFSIADAVIPTGSSKMKMRGDKTDQQG